MPYPSLDTCIPIGALSSFGGRVYASEQGQPSRRVKVFSDPVARVYETTSERLSEAEVLAIKAATFDLVGYSGIVEFTVPGEGSPRLWRFDRFAPTKNTATDYSLALTLREALGF